MKEKGEFKRAIKFHEESIKYEPENLTNYYYLSDLKKDILDLNLRNKIEKIISKKKTTKANIAYGNYLLSRYEEKDKNYEQELGYLKIGHQSFFDSKKIKFDLGIKYCFDDVLKIAEGVSVENRGKINNSEVKPIFIIGVPRSGSTLVEKIIGSGSKSIPMGEETAVLENFVNSKILEKKIIKFRRYKSN